VNFLVRKQVSLSCRLGDQTLVLAMLAQFGQGLRKRKDIYRLERIRRADYQCSMLHLQAIRVN